MAIKIKAKNKGKFTASAKKAGKSVQEHAHDVMNNPNATPLQRKRANFAIQAKRWNHELGGPVKYDIGGQNWDNLATSPQNQSSQGIGKSSITGSQVSGYAGAAANALSPVIPKGNYQPTSQASSVIGGIKEGAKAVPFVGGFVQAGDMLGKGFQAGIDKANQKENKAGASAAAFAQGLVDPIAEHQKVWDLQKKGKISKGEAAGWSILNFMGGAGIANAVLENKYKDSLYPSEINPTQQSNLSFSVKPTTNSEIQSTTPEDFMNYGGSLRSMSKYNNGGQLEQHNLPLHSQMADDWANAQLDGKPVQINAKETIFRKKNGGDYVFSDNKEMLNPKTGNTFAEDSKKIEKKTQKPYFDPASLNVKKYQLNELSKVNDVERAKVESKMYSGIPKALNGEDGNQLPYIAPRESQIQFSGYSGIPENYLDPSRPMVGGEIMESPNYYNFNTVSPYKYQNLKQGDSFVGTGGKIDAALNVNKVIDNTPDLNIKKSNLNIPEDNKLKFKKSKQDRRIELHNNSNLTPGDKWQLLGQIPALAYNAVQAFKKPEQQKLYLDRTPITQQSIAKNYNPSYLALNAAYKGIDEGTTSDAVRRASKISALSGVVPKLQEYDLAVDNANQSLRGQYEDKITNQSRFNVGQRLTTDDINARNRAATRAFGATAASNLGQGLTTFGIAKNQGLTNTIQYSTLQELAANYGLDPDNLAELYKNQGKIILGYKGKK